MDNHKNVFLYHYYYLLLLKLFIMINSKVCLECGNRLVGRSDKKFCSNECKNSYHNKVYFLEQKTIKDVNRILSRNRRILLNCVNNKRRQISENYLLSRGFNFNYYTHLNHGPNGELTHFCYEIGYQRDEARNKLRLLKEDANDVYRMNL